MPGKPNRKSYGRGRCRYCQVTRNLTRQGTMEPHPIPGNAPRASRCIGSGISPIATSVKAVA